MYVLTYIPLLGDSVYRLDWKILHWSDRIFKDHRKKEEDGSFRCMFELKLCCSQQFNCMQCWHPASVLIRAFGNRYILWETDLFSERGRNGRRILPFFSCQSSHWHISCVIDLLLSAALIFSVYGLVVSLKDQTSMITTEF